MRRIFKTVSLEQIILLCIVFLFVIVLYSVFRSTYSYQFDNDEYYHAQITYLIDHGNIIYRSFYATYTPLFYWVLRPLFHVLGYTTEVLFSARLLMILFFFLRLFVVFLGIRTLFSTKAAFFGIFFLILDPFAVISAANIRPDTLMLLFFSLGLTFYIFGRKQNKKFFLLFSGIFVALSLMTLMKIVPSVVAFLCVAGLSAIVRKQLKREGLVFLGFISAIAVMLFFFVVQGLLYGVVLQTILDPITLFTGLQYPVYFGFFLKEGNMWVFGLANRSLAWVYAQLVAPLSGIGIGHAYSMSQNHKVSSLARDVLVILVAALVLQWIWLTTVPSVFVQYYLTLNWIGTVLAGCAVASFWTESASKNFITRSLVYCGIGGFFLVFAYGGYNVNMFRSGITSKNELDNIQAVWNVIPKNSPVFPNFLFRPLVHPIPHRLPFNEMPQAILNRMPSVSRQLDSLGVQYVFNDVWFMQSLPEDAQAYIKTHFRPSTANSQVLVRNVSAQ